MSTSAYYNFISAAGRANMAAANSIEARRQTAVSPSSFATSSSNSSSSLNQFNSLTQVSVDSSTSSASSTSSTSNNSHIDTSHFYRAYRQPRGSIDVYNLQSNSSTPTRPHHSSSQLFPSYANLHSLEHKPLKPYKTRSEYLEAMKEDLAEWLNRLYSDLDLTPDNFFAQLETGSIICRHANNVIQMGRDHQSNAIDSHSSSLIESNNNNNNDSISPDYKSHSLRSLSLTSSLSQSARMSPEQRNINWLAIKMLSYKRDAISGTFFARDNICQFIMWCRSLNILDCLLFETDDLVARKNERSFILCLLEVARIGFKVGMPTPLIIQLEQEIDREIENDAKLQKQLEEKQNQDDKCAIEETFEQPQDSHSNLSGIEHTALNIQQLSDDKQAIKQYDDIELASPKVEPEEKTEKQGENQVEVEVEEEEDFGPKPQVITNDLLSLHERVVQLLCQCTCPTQFPMVRVGENGKYKVGDKLIIFVRILRRHIMVRVGGGWQELSEFLRVKDPCRSKVYQAHAHLHNHTIHQQQQPLVSHQQQQLSNGKLLNSHLIEPKSRLVESSLHLNKGQHGYNYRHASGSRSISNSASMSWLSHNT